MIGNSSRDDTHDSLGMLSEFITFSDVPYYLINLANRCRSQVQLLQPHMPLDVTANISSLLLIHEIKMYSRNKMIGNSIGDDTHDSLG